MAQRKTLGGDRIGSGSKMKVDTKTFNRSTHDLGFLWRSTMSAGTLVPFMSEVILPGDSLDLNLGCEVLTLPTVGPLFGSMKVQLDVYTAPVRLYQGQLHNNKLGIGMNMSAVKLPILEFTAPIITQDLVDQKIDIDNWQVNPSSIMSYLGVRGFGITENELAINRKRRFNGVPLLAYWDIYKNYYANKQENIGMVIHNAPVGVDEEIADFDILTNGVNVALMEYPTITAAPLAMGSLASLNTANLQNMDVVMVSLELIGGRGDVEWVKFTDLFNIYEQDTSEVKATYNHYIWGDRVALSYRYINAGDAISSKIAIQEFPLDEIDEMREKILSATETTTPFDVFGTELLPYDFLPRESALIRSITGSQEGLGLKTYQSDLFNNWLDTEYIDGVNGIAAVTAVSTAGDEFTIDSLILHKKVYDMLNDILVSGGTYDDWNEVVFDHKSITRAETPVYHGSLIKELQFQEVVSNAEAGTNPLGTLAGRGRLGSKHKGGKIEIKVDEIGYLMGIVSITPRIDYSQGNSWDVNLETMDDFHKPYMDEIGFQELITDQMAWWDTTINNTGEVVFKSAGKQPAWINYMTNVNRIRGNFAMRDNSMFMVLARRYEPVFGAGAYQIDDLTTYIDPTKFNHIFAVTSLDSQNYWVQIGVDLVARRKLSARVMPNL